MNPVNSIAKGPVGQQLDASPVLDAVYSKVNWRLLPLLLLAYVVAFVDRVNIGYAQLQMKQHLPFGDAVYAAGAGIFFLGFLLFEVPSNLMLQKIGVRKTMLRIMVLWGAAAVAMVFVTTPMQFYVARFLLGVFEAGFFPGVILYFTFWYPSARRGRVIAIFMTAAAVGSVIVGPLSGATLKYLDGALGWAGWQWLFLSQGLPAVVLGIALYFRLDDRPADARWLTVQERRLLQGELDRDATQARSSQRATWRQGLADPRLYSLSAVYFLLLGATYTVVFSMPTLIQSFGVKDFAQIGLLAAIPSGLGVLSTIWFGRSSDRHRERRWHFVACMALAIVGLGIAVQPLGSLPASMAALALAVLGIAAATPLFFTLLTEYFPPAMAAIGIAIVSSLGNLGAAAAPSMKVWVAQQTGSAAYSFYMVMALYLASALLLLLTVRASKASGHG